MTTTVPRNRFVEQLIAIGIPLLLISLAARSLGLELLSSQCIWMTVIASTLQTIAVHFYRENTKVDFVSYSAMLSSYNVNALFSVAATVIAIVVVVYA